MAGNRAVGADLDPPAPVRVGAGRLGRGTPVRPAARTPAARVHRLCDAIAPRFSPALIVSPRSSIAVAGACSRTVTPSSARSLAAFAESFSLKACTTRSPGVDEDHTSRRGVDPREPGLQVVAGEDREKAWRLDPRGGRRRRPRRSSSVPTTGSPAFSACSNADTIRSRISIASRGSSAEGPVSPFVAAEVGGLGAGGDHQAVVVERSADRGAPGGPRGRGRRPPPSGRLVRLSSEMPTDRGGDIARGHPPPPPDRAAAGTGGGSSGPPGSIAPARLSSRPRSAPQNRRR